MLSCNAPKDTHVEAALYNNLGQQVRPLKPASGRTEVEAGALASGLYFVCLTTEGGRVETQPVTLVR